MENFATLMGWEGLFSHKANFPVFYYILKLLVREYIIFHKTVKKGLKSLTLLKFVSQFFSGTNLFLMFTSWISMEGGS